MSNWILALPPILGILLVSLVISLVITLVYRRMTDQKLMGELKAEIKNLQKEMKEQKEKPKKMLEIQKKAMEKNMQYMSHSMKPTLVTMIPVILVFSWLSGHFAYEPITPNTPFTVSAHVAEGISNIELSVPSGIEFLSTPSQEVSEGIATWKLKGKKGEYTLDYTTANRTFSQEILITEERSYKMPEKPIKEKGSPVKLLRTNLEPVKPFGSLDIFGWKPGWLGAYIIFSIVFSMSLRKIMKIQ